MEQREQCQAKKQEVSKLSAKADEKLRDFYTIKERGNWQDPMFFAMSAYIYRIDEGLQFCIKAIQDFAYSGFGARCYICFIATAVHSPTHGGSPLR